MPRRGSIVKHDASPDPPYKSKLVTELVNNIIPGSKKGVSQRIACGAFDIVNEKMGKDPLETFKQVMENVAPALEIKTRRVDGVTYQVPMEARPERGQTLGLCWITRYSRLRSERTIKGRLAGEIPDAINDAGGATRKRDDTHRMAEAGRAFVHYRW